MNRRSPEKFSGQARARTLARSVACTRRGPASLGRRSRGGDRSPPGKGGGGRRETRERRGRAPGERGAFAREKEEVPPFCRVLGSHGQPDILVLSLSLSLCPCHSLFLSFFRFSVATGPSSPFFIREGRGTFVSMHSVDAASRYSFATILASRS